MRFFVDPQKGADMKKLLLLAIILGCIGMSAGSAFALSDGSSPNVDMPEAPGLCNFETEWGNCSLIGTAGVRMMKLNLEEVDGQDAQLEGSELIAGLGLRICDRFEPYVRLGISDLEIKWGEAEGEDDYSVEVDGDLGILAGGGLKVELYKCRMTSLSTFRWNAEGQLLYMNAPVGDQEITASDTGASSYLSAADFYTYQGRVATTIGFDFSLGNLAEEWEEGEVRMPPMHIIPYAGVVFSQSWTTAKFSLDDVSYGQDNINQKYNVNLITGLDIVAPKYVTLNVEAEWFRDESISGGLNVKF